MGGPKLNPYVYVNPISNSDLFVDREEELKEIKNFLNECKETQRFQKLLITGSKGSGKTSLINMIKKEYVDDIVIDLEHTKNSNESVEILAQCFDTIINAPQIINSLSIIDRLLDFMNGFKVGGGITLPGIAVNIERQNTVSKDDLKHNFTRLQDKIKKPIILLCDDCNIIADSKALPEINNFFSRLNGYHIIFCGTDDENIKMLKKAFYPFTNIVSLNNFDYEDTEKAVYKPLTDSEKDLVNPKDIEDIYLLTLGHPFLVNFFCHYMYHEYLESQNFELNKNVCINLVNKLPNLGLEANLSNFIAEGIIRFKIAKHFIKSGIDKMVDEKLLWAGPNIIQFFIRGARSV